MQLNITQPTITIPACCQDNTNLEKYFLSSNSDPKICPDGSTEMKDASASLCDQLIICCQSTTTSADPYFSSLVSCPPASKPVEKIYCDENARTEGGSCGENGCAPPLICNSVFHQCMYGSAGIQCGTDDD